MKKTWNSPEVQELTIQATAFGHFGSGYGGGRPGNGGGSGNGGRPGNGDFGWGNGGGCGKDDLCRCQGGTSPCERHHFGDEDLDS